MATVETMNCKKCGKPERKYGDGTTAPHPKCVECGKCYTQFGNNEWACYDCNPTLQEEMDK